MTGTHTDCAQGPCSQALQSQTAHKLALLTFLKIAQAVPNVRLSNKWKNIAFKYMYHSVNGLSSRNVQNAPWKLTQITTPSGPISSPLKKSEMSDSEALNGSPRRRTTLLRFLRAHPAARGISGSQETWHL